MSKQLDLVVESVARRGLTYSQKQPEWLLRAPGTPNPYRDTNTIIALLDKHQNNVIESILWAGFTPPSTWYRARPGGGGLQDEFVQINCFALQAYHRSNLGRITDEDAEELIILPDGRVNFFITYYVDEEAANVLRP